MSDEIENFLGAWLDDLGLTWLDIFRVGCWYDVIRDHEREARTGFEQRFYSRFGPQHFSVTTWADITYYKDRQNDTKG